MKKYLLLALLAASSLTACKKDKDTAPAKTKAELLVDKKWRLSALTGTYTDGGKLQTKDGYTTIPSYTKDDFYTFKADKTLTYDEGPTKQNTSAPQSYPGTWDLNSDQTKLYISPAGGSATAYDLTELTETTMIQTIIVPANPTTSQPEVTVKLTYNTF